ncbi:MAG TPA: hypothetical protein VEB21_07275 [Terriglobales bacterium]|nr:hypothetical protein [Terriglobales bacterium]
MLDLRKRSVREAMSVRVDINGAVAETIGSAGVAAAEVEALQPQLIAVADDLRAQRQAGQAAFYELPYERESLAATKALAETLREESETLVVLGIGGSALGTKTLIESVADGSRAVRVADNIDPWSFGALLDGLDLQRTTFNVISKSGETAETMSQFLIVRELLLRQLGGVDYVSKVILTTDAGKGALRQVVHDEGFRSLVIPAAVGGRFSVLTPVGLLPAAFAGIRLDDLLAGAAWMDERCQEPEIWKNPGHLLGTLLYLADTKHRQNIATLMPYSDRLHWFAAWFAQLWAESLGKAQHLDGTAANVGQTPLTAVGATDQHSLLQLFAEGPKDKITIMLRVEDHGRELPVASAYKDIEPLAYLGGTGLGKLLNMEQRGTEVALVKQGRPVITLSVPQINAFTIGQLFYLFEVATVFAGGLYRIDPFNQPGVEESKRLTYGQVGRAGFDAKSEEVRAYLANKKDHLIV